MSLEARDLKFRIQKTTPWISKASQLPWSTIVPVLTLFIVFVAFSLMNESFLHERNLTNLFRQVTVNCILAFGMTVIILLGGIDLSVGSLLALGSVVAGVLMSQQGFELSQMGLMGSLISFAAVFVVCGSFGAFTGTLVSRFQMPPFVVTLGIFVIARGLALIISGGQKFGDFNPSFTWPGSAYLPIGLSNIFIVSATLLITLLIARSYFRSLSRGLRKKSPVWIFQILICLAIASALFWVFQYRGIPISVLIMLGVFTGIWFLLNKTVFGRSVYAIGGNPEAARLCGIRVSRVIFTSFVLMGFCVALASIIETGRLSTGDPTGGQLYELDAIAAVVIGGSSLQGGVGRIQGTLIGAILIGTLNNGMSLMNVASDVQMVIKGLIIIGAVWVDVVSKRKSS